MKYSQYEEVVKYAAKVKKKSLAAKLFSIKSVCGLRLYMLA